VIDVATAASMGPAKKRGAASSGAVVVVGVSDMVVMLWELGGKRGRGKLHVGCGGLHACMDDGLGHRLGGDFIAVGEGRSDMYGPAQRYRDLGAAISKSYNQ
jgi:hypothetical protein